MSALDVRLLAVLVLALVLAAAGQRAGVAVPALPIILVPGVRL